VDPYYLAYKAEEIGHHPQIIMAGRRINDAMGRYFGRELIKKMIEKRTSIRDAKVLILGITFKEDVPDIRNSRVLDIMKELKDFGVIIHTWDPVADPAEVKHEYGINIIRKAPANGKYDGVVLAVKHKEFLGMGAKGLRKFCKKNGVFYDIKEVIS
jgi:UDP-N-acetyl-D-galactosamine dehydrogenase